MLRGEAFERALDGVLRDAATPSGCGCSRPTARSGLRRMLTGVYETLRSAGRPLALELGEQADLARAAGRAARGGAGACSPIRGATEKQRAAARAALELSSPPERLLDLAGLRARAATGPPRSRRRASGRAGGARRARGARQRAAAGAARPVRRRVRGREGARVGARLRGPAAARARPARATTRGSARPSSCASARSWSTSSRTRTAPVRARRPARAAARRAGRLLRRRRVPVDLRLPPRRRRRLPRAARGRGAAAAADRNYRSRPEVLAAVNHLFGAEFGDGYQPLAASGEFPDPVFGHPVELLVTDKAVVPRRRGEHWRAPRRSASRGACASSSTRAPRRRARSCCCSPPAPTPSGTRRSCARSGCRPTARPAAATSASSRSSTCSCTCGCCATATTTRRSSRCSPRRSSASRTTRSCSIRRHAGRRPLFTGIERSLPEALSEGDERLVRAFKQRYERLVAASARVVARAAVRAGRRGARLRPRRARALGRPAPVREPAQADAARALLRGAARAATSRASSRFIRDQEALGAAQLEAVSEEEGADAVRLLTIHAAKGLEFKVVVVADAGRDTGGAAGGGRDPRALRRPLRLQGRRTRRRAAAPASSATRRCASAEQRGRRAPSGCASTTSR